MQRSGSQKFLLVVSIISIVVAVLGIITGLLAMVGGAMLGSLDPQEASEALNGTGMSQDQAGAMVGTVGIVLIVCYVVQLIVGILGVRAANDNQKIMPVWVLALVELILYCLSLVFTVVNGDFGTQGATIIGSLLVAVLMFWVANNIKKQAGR